jgi:hypothetical protein
MRRARADDSFTWEPFNHGRQRRIAALVAVGLCAGVVGLVVGRVSSGGTVESARAPPPSAVTTKKDQAASATPASPPVVLANPATEQQTSRNSNKQIPSRTSEPMPVPVNPEYQTSPASVPAVRKQNDQVLPPTPPPVVLLNPGSGQQNADVRERQVPEQARERQHSLALVPRSEKRVQEVGPARAARRDVQRSVPSNVQEANRRPWRRQQKGATRSPSIEASPPPKTRVLRSERPAAFADYGALRDYMMRQ